MFWLSLDQLDISWRQFPVNLTRSCGSALFSLVWETPACSRVVCHGWDTNTDCGENFPGCSTCRSVQALWFCHTPRLICLCRTVTSRFRGFSSFAAALDSLCSLCSSFSWSVFHCWLKQVRKSSPFFLQIQNIRLCGRFDQPMQLESGLLVSPVCSQKDIRIPRHHQPTVNCACDTEQNKATTPTFLHIAFRGSITFHGSITSWGPPGWPTGIQLNTLVSHIKRRQEL